MSAAERAAKLRKYGDFVVRNGEMWCNSCGILIRHDHENFGKNHVKTTRHQKNVQLGVRKFGPQSSQQAESSGTAAVSRQPMPQELWCKEETANRINSDFAAAFLHAGLPLHALDNPSIRGLFKKYTQVSGTVHTGSWQKKDKSVKRLIDDQLHSIRSKLGIGNNHGFSSSKKIHGPGPGRFFVSFDEWTDSSGACNVHVLVGKGPHLFMVDSAILECKGPNDGLENTELTNAIHDALTKVGLCSDDVHFFVTDNGGPVPPAVRALQKRFPKARHLVCLSHTLNNCAIQGLEADGFHDVEEFWKHAKALVHPKRYSARRRRWFAFLRAGKRECQVPPKWCRTRWVGWRDVSEWWLQHFDTFMTFMSQEASRHTDDTLPPNALFSFFLLNSTRRADGPLMRD